MILKYYTFALGYCNFSANDVTVGNHESGNETQFDNSGLYSLSWVELVTLKKKEKKKKEFVEISPKIIQKQFLRQLSHFHNYITPLIYIYIYIYIYTYNLFIIYYLFF